MRAKDYMATKRIVEEERAEPSYTLNPRLLEPFTRCFRQIASGRLTTPAISAWPVCAVSVFFGVLQCLVCKHLPRVQSTTCWLLRCSFAVCCRHAPGRPFHPPGQVLEVHLQCKFLLVLVGLQIA